MHFRISITLKPDFHASWLYLGRLFAMKQDYDKVCMPNKKLNKWTILCFWNKIRSKSLFNFEIETQNFWIFDKKCEIKTHRFCKKDIKFTFWRIFSSKNCLGTFILWKIIKITWYTRWTFLFSKNIINITFLARKF